MTNTLTTLRSAKEIAQQVRGDYMLDGKELEALKASHLALIASMEAQEPFTSAELVCMNEGYVHSKAHGLSHHAQPSEPKSEPASDDLTIAYMSGFHDGKKAKAEPVQEPASCDTCKHAANPPSQPPCNGCMDSEDFHFFESDSPFCAKCGSTGSAQPTAEPAQGPVKPSRMAFEHHWVNTRRQKKSRHELQRHPEQPQTYVADNANRHWVTWQAAVKYAAPQARKPLTTQQIDEAVTNWFADDWAQKAARGMLEDLDIEGGAA